VPEAAKTGGGGFLLNIKVMPIKSEYCSPGVAVGRGFGRLSGFEGIYFGARLRILAFYGPGVKYLLDFK
jgi:hypothetical protein